jgi:hypothetical protein
MKTADALLVLLAVVGVLAFCAYVGAATMQMLLSGVSG